MYITHVDVDPDTAYPAAFWVTHVHPHVIGALARRWQLRWTEAEQVGMRLALAERFPTFRELCGVARYAAGERQLPSPGAFERAQERRRAFEADPQGRFSIRYATFADWAASRSPSNSTPEYYQRLRAVHDRHPTATLYQLNALINQNLQYAGWGPQTLAGYLLTHPQF
jgi:hypothetical protein